MNTTYQSQLNWQPPKIAPTTPLPLPRPRPPVVIDLGEITIEEAVNEVQLLDRLERALTEGFWFCVDGGHTCERIEGEQGQPAHCSVCARTRLEWNPPTFELVEAL